MTLEALDNISCDIEPVADSHLANKAYVDAAVANGAGTASVSGDSVVSIPAHSLISCDLAPTDDAHLVNKAYVDAAVAAAGTATPIEEPAALGRVVIVDTLSDAASHTGTSLRDAIDAVTDKGSVVIKFSVSGTITLEQGEIVIPVGNISIDGEDKITISGGGVSRVFAVSNAYSILSLHRLIIENGNGVGASASQVNGGAIVVASTTASLYAKNVKFYNNTLAGTDSASTLYGGAVSNNGGKSVFADCEFRGNSINTTRNYSTGGALHAGGYTLCDRCVFAENTSTAANTGRGGAVYSYGGIFRDCVFEDNSTGGPNRYGGALFVEGFALIIGCIFRRNITGSTNNVYYGGAIFHNGFYCVIEGCSFTNNVSERGGDIYISGNTARQYSITIRRCNFDGGAGYASGRGSAICTNYGSATIEDCEFKNHAVGSASGIIYAYGYTGKLFVVTINRCKFTGNSASTATTGLIYCANLAQCYLCNCVFTANSFTATSGNHKCVYTTGTGTWAFIYNCTFTNNTNNGGAFYAAAGGVDIYNSVEYGNGSASGKGTNATVNAAKFMSDQSTSVGRDIAYDSTKPLFAADGFTPVANSQVIDAGNNNYVMTAYDLPGKTRVSGTKVDLGAVEYQQGS